MWQFSLLFYMVLSIIIDGDGGDGQFWCTLTLRSHLSSGGGRRGGHGLLQAWGAGVQAVLGSERLEEEWA